MITKKDARLIRDVLRDAFDRCQTPKEREGVMRVDSMFIKAWDEGKIGFNESLIISEYTKT